MNNHRLLTLAAVVGLAAATLFFAPSNLLPEAQAEEASIQKWEYKVVGVNIMKLGPVNALGAQGWELVEGSTSTWVFKRQLP